MNSVHLKLVLALFLINTLKRWHKSLNGKASGNDMEDISSATVLKAKTNNIDLRMTLGQSDIPFEIMVELKKNYLCVPMVKSVDGPRKSRIKLFVAFAAWCCKKWLAFGSFSIRIFGYIFDANFNDFIEMNLSRSPNTNIPFEPSIFFGLFPLFWPLSSSVCPDEKFAR